MYKREEDGERVSRFVIFIYSFIHHLISSIQKSD